MVSEGVDVRQIHKSQYADRAAFTSKYVGSEEPKGRKGAQSSGKTRSLGLRRLSVVSGLDLMKNTETLNRLRRLSASVGTMEK
jgi:hypothetical protein